MFSCSRIHTLLSFLSAILLWNLSCARPRLDRLERRTSRSYFARCGRGSSSSLERLSSAVPIRKILASFDVNKVGVEIFKTSKTPRCVFNLLFIYRVLFVHEKQAIIEAYLFRRYCFCCLKSCSFAFSS